MNNKNIEKSSYHDREFLVVIGNELTAEFVCLFVGCLTSQQHAGVSQGQICSDNFTCCHTETEVADPTFYLTQSQYTDTGPTSPSADPIPPGAWQGSHWSANFESLVWLDPEKIPAQAGFEPGIFCSRDRLIGLVVRHPPRERKIPGSNPACAEIFSGSSHTSDLRIGTPVATLPGAWRYRVSTGTGRPVVSILWLGEVERLICNFYLSVTARKIVWADPSLRYTSLLLGR